MSSTNFPDRHRELQAGLRTLGAAQPKVMEGFGGMHKAATGDGTLDAKTKELMALAISVAVRCDGCIAFHVHDAIAAGATAEEIAEAVGVAVLMGGGPAAVYGADALRAYEQFTNDDDRSDDPALAS